MHRPTAKVLGHGPVFRMRQAAGGAVRRPRRRRRGGPTELDDQLVDRATAVGVQSEYHRIPGAGHGYDESEFFSAEVVNGRTSFQRLLSFAKDVLIGP
jgi:hypothetical protein